MNENSADISRLYKKLLRHTKKEKRKFLFFLVGAIKYV